jgi:uncharacterized protein (TIGR01619 family)
MKFRPIVIGTILILVIVAVMGLLGDLFGKKNKKEISDSKYREEWDFYFSNIENKPGSIALDLGLFKVAPIKNRDNVCWISIEMLEPREDGLSSTNESIILGELEEQLAGKMKEKHSAIYAGRMTSNGKRAICFYLGDTTLVDKTISDIMVTYPKYLFDYEIREDKTWGNYFEFLYPLPEQYQCMLNRRVVDNLEKNGDKLIKERPVDHWIFFKTDNDKKAYLDKVIADGFQIVTNDFDKSLGEYPYRLHISRVDKVDNNSVDEYVIHLWKLANEMNGDYDGWETSIEKD